MAKPGRATQGKRIRERAKLEKQKEKQERRNQRKEAKDNKLRPAGEADPDLAGIVPGPQPPRE